jgi:hypothetical protein
MVNDDRRPSRLHHWWNELRRYPWWLVAMAAVFVVGSVGTIIFYVVTMATRIATE